ncbi:MAG: allantoate amidohydrolase, partial [Betaproteobacteria bacterium]
MASHPSHGQQIMEWSERIAAFSEPTWAEKGQLTVTYLTPSHLQTAQALTQLMQEAGFDDVSTDAVGNVVGRYHGTDTAAPALLTGSHFDTVRNGGKYDGRLGILVPIAVVG